MSLTRLNRIVMSGVVPFNFGMTWEDWQASYEQFGPGHPFVGDMAEPATWSDEEKTLVNAQAARETAVVDELMGIEDHAAFERQLTYYQRMLARCTPREYVDD